MVVDGLAGWLGYGVRSAAVGAVVGLAVGTARSRLPAVAVVCGGVLLGCVGWLIWSLTLVPILAGETPTWSSASAAASYPQLVGDLLHGGLTGAFLSGSLSLRSRRTGTGGDAPSRPLARIVIVGGGFGGVSAARTFERLALRGAPVDVTLVSDSNYLLFTPMLAEVASGAGVEAYQCAGAGFGAAHPVPARAGGARGSGRPHRAGGRPCGDDPL